MLSRVLLPLALSVACSSATVLSRDAAPEAASVGHAGFVSFPIVERQAVSSGLRRRGNDATLYNFTNTAYVMEIEVGTPGQKIRVLIDTGSDELWLNPNCTNNELASSVEFCESQGSYDADASSSSENLGESTNLTYGKGETIIDYYADDLTILGTNDTKLTNVQFGVAENSVDVFLGILGVGFGNDYNLDYMNVIDQLVSQGAIASHAFSLVLGTGTDDDDVGDDIANGAIIFGGVDTKKFSGTLKSLDIQPAQVSGDVTEWRYWVNLKSVGFTQPGSSSSVTYEDSNATVTLDSGSSLSYLPLNVVESIATSLGVSLTTEGDSTASSLIVVDCNIGQNGGTFDFNFDNVTINVPLTSFMWEYEGDCIIGVAPASDPNLILLGDTFLRSVYALFDQDNMKIYLADAANCGTNEQSIGNSSSYSFTGECSASTPTSSSSSSTSTSKSASATLYPLSLSALLAFVGLQSLMMLQ